MNRRDLVQRTGCARPAGGRRSRRVAGGTPHPGWGRTWRATVGAPTLRAPRKLEVGRIGESRPARRRRPEGQGRVRVLERPRRARDALGPHRPQPARARAHHARSTSPRRSRMPGVHAVLTHEDVPGEKTLRARVPRPARARDRPRPLLRRAGRARRRRASRAGAPRRRAGPRRVRAARAGGRHGARDSRRPSSIPTADAAATATATTTAPNVVRHIVIRHGDPDAEGDVVGQRRLRDRHPGPGVPRPRVRARGARRRGRDRHLRRDAVASRRPGADRAVPRRCRSSRCASTSPASAARSAGARTSRCRSTARCSRCTRTAR